ncbi:tRNA pseudouridine(65) synthase TruC [Aliidiomarina sanyensis]|uniref:tRNA pseudouridine synthase C n=1 Tax=Aliidiomarina sanyensis TaxID=1249555 RepID=A0A432WRF7_9GAMM|nr:tRNA pseudouridine(65) synthase TruC [Aliidiomarina sanyensis]RUO36309.1 tRNA pseudouridine(65) synthase TruC [Aliidiomarina sanyensis]
MDVTEPSPLEICYEDEALIAIDKPAGLLVHRTALARGERWFAMQLLRDQIGQHVFPVHRLDRPTSGILLFAKSAELATLVSEKFAERSVEKIYHAVVRGYVPESGQVDYPLKEELDKIADKMADQNKAPQPAVTDFKRLATVELPYAVSKKHATTRYSLVRLKPYTGRKHQIRRHMAHLRHPIVGDTNHGDGRHNRFFREHFGIQRLLLAATSLRIQHPLTGQALDIEISVPDDFYRPFPDAVEHR